MKLRDKWIKKKLTALFSKKHELEFSQWVIEICWCRHTEFWLTLVLADTNYTKLTQALSRLMHTWMRTFFNFVPTAQLRHWYLLCIAPHYSPHCSPRNTNLNLLIGLQKSLTAAILTPLHSCSIVRVQKIVSTYLKLPLSCSSTSLYLCSTTLCIACILISSDFSIKKKVS